MYARRRLRISRWRRAITASAHMGTNPMLLRDDSKMDGASLRGVCPHVKQRVSASHRDESRDNLRRVVQLRVLVQALEAEGVRRHEVPVGVTRGHREGVEVEHLSDGD